MYLVTAREMREMDEKTITDFGLPGRVLMENAGRSAARILLEKFDGIEQKRVAVAAGRGNNGGDGFVIARYLALKGIDVTVYLFSENVWLKGDALDNFNLLKPLAVPVIEIPDYEAFISRQSSMRHQHIWVDALLGTGLNTDVKDLFYDIITFINSLNTPVLAVDIPSGLNSDTGRPCGACIKADITVTFGFAKPGHILFPGADFTGDLEIVDIGIPPHITESIGPQTHLITPEMAAGYFTPRQMDDHKGKTGHLLVIAGSPGKTGAAAMTATSAMRTGAGLVTLGIPESLNPVLETQVIEVMTCPLPETDTTTLSEFAFDKIYSLMDGKNCLAIGPGIGTDESTKRLFCKLLMASKIPVVVDADGLNILAENIHLLKTLHNPVVLTPHPGEMSRLTGKPTAVIQSDRINTARDFAVKHKVHLVLKGARSVIAHPDGRAYINPTGNPGMAAGGMGDVLTGIIAGLITQGMSIDKASRAGTFLHGAAADMIESEFAPYGYLASEVMGNIPLQIKNLLTPIKPAMDFPFKRGY